MEDILSKALSGELERESEKREIERIRKYDQYKNSMKYKISEMEYELNQLRKEIESKNMMDKRNKRVEKALNKFSNT
tara:strand:+ start:24786 stop:25016 length:231 start_codon:yes stop_codon:yes gene_type:complete